MYGPGDGESSVEERSGLQQRGGCRGDEGMGVCEFVVFNSSDMGGSEGQQQTLVPGVSGTKQNLHTHTGSSTITGHWVVQQDLQLCAQPLSAAAGRAPAICQMSGFSR